MLGSLMTAHASRTEENPPKELLQYIQEARRRGVKESRIREQALSVGWSAATVDSAISHQTGSKDSKRDGTSENPASSSARQGSTGELPSPAALTSVAIPSQAAGLSEASSSRAVPDDYQIGAGDTLQVSVWKEPDVTVPSVVVRPDGKITIPLIKEVEVAGRTPRQAEMLITDGLSKFITDANVTVVVAAINSKKVYVIGAVRKEGTLPYTYGMTIMQALSEVGGLTDYAKRKRIYVLRTENGRDYRLDFNYEEVVRGERMEQNMVLLPGDTVVIPH